MLVDDVESYAICRYSTLCVTSTSEPLSSATERQGMHLHSDRSIPTRSCPWYLGWILIIGHGLHLPSRWSVASEGDHTLLPKVSRPGRVTNGPLCW